MDSGNGRIPSPRQQREGNQERVLKALSELGAVSLDELVRATGLAKGTVYGAVRKDGALGAVLAPSREVRLVDGPGGRATKYFSLKPYVAIGVDFDHDRV